MSVEKDTYYPRYMVHRFWLVHGYSLCTHIQQVLINTVCNLGKSQYYRVILKQRFHIKERQFN